MTAKKSKRKQRPSKAVRTQAQRIHEYTVFTEVLSESLIRRFARRIDGGSERGALLLDYPIIVKVLAAGDPGTKSAHDGPPMRGLWERYAHHFQNLKTRRNFFAEIDRMAKGYLANIVFCQVDAALHHTVPERPEFLWSEILFPRKTAPQLVRQWISDSARTQRFLTALFQHFAGVHRKGSIARRAIIAANVADKIGWKPQKITKSLVQTGDISLGQHETRADRKLVLDREASTVGRSIRRMRKADKERRAKINAEKRRQRAADRAALKAARLKKEATQK
jgi:hypothetical protein